MAETSNFQIIGRFEDNVTESLSRINRLLRSQMSIQRRLNAQSRRLARIHSQIAQDAADYADNTEEQADGANQLARNALAAKMKAMALEKLSAGITKGVGDSIRNLQKVVGKFSSIIQRSFSEAMSDQLDDIQATAAAYGSLTSEGLIDKSKPGSYKTAKKLYKKLDSEIAEVVKSSTAPTSTITYFSRTLTDNLLPTILKEAKKNGLSTEDAITPASQTLARFYEKAALLTPAGYSPGMVSKSLQMALGGSTEKQLLKYDFFQMNPTVLNRMQSEGFFTKDDFKAKFDILQMALETGLPQDAIDEMGMTISGGMQALNDTFWNPTVGILSFARTFAAKSDANILNQFRRNRMEQMGLSDPAARYQGSDEDLAKLMGDISTPLDIVSSTLGPFLQDLASLFGEAPTIMGNVAIYWDTYFAPGLRSLTYTLKVLQDNMKRGIMDLPESIGRFMAEGLKVVTGLFSSDMSVSGETLMDEFIEGFNSLGHEIDWTTLINKVFGQVKQFLESMVAKIFTAIIAWSMAWAIAGAVVQIFSQLATYALIETGKWLLPKLLSWVVGTAFPSIMGFVTTGLLPLTLLVVKIVAIVAIVVRYRKEIKEQFEGLWQVLTGMGQALLGLGKIIMGIMVWPIAFVTDLIMAGIRAIPIFGEKWAGDGSDPSATDRVRDDLIIGGYQDMVKGGENIKQGGAKAINANLTVLFDASSLIKKLSDKARDVLLGVESVTDVGKETSEEMAETSGETAQKGVELLGETTTAAITQSQAALVVSQQANEIKASYPAIARTLNGLAGVIASIQLSSGGYGGAAIGELSGSLMERAKKMFETLRGMGFSKYGAAALVGSMMQESGIDPNAVEHNGQGHGLLQWSFGRRDKLKQRYGNDWNNVNNQLEYMMSEKGSEGALNRLMNAQSRESAFAAEKSYIRYGIAGKRYGYADKIMQQEWFKYKGHIPNGMNNLKAVGKLQGGVARTQSLMKSASQSDSSSSETYEFDLTNTEDNSKQLYELGRRVAPGVVSKLDECISSSPLFQF